MIYKIFTIVLLCSFAIFSQNIEDNLLSKINNADELGKIEIYNKLCWKLRSNDQAKSIRYGNEAVKLITKINKPKLYSKTYNFLGVTYRNSGNYGKALFYYTKALNNALEYSDSIQIAYSHNNLGGIYRLQGNNPLALEHMLIALKYFENINNQAGIGFCAINIGIVYLNEGSFPQALKFLNYSLEVRKKLNYQQGIALSLNQIAIVHTKMKDYDKAIEYYKELLSLFTKLNDRKGIAACYEGFSTINYEEGNYSASLKNILTSKNMLEQVKDKVGIIRNYGKMALIYARLKNFSLGKESLNKTKVGVKELNIEVAYVKLYKTQSDFYEIVKDYKKAYFFHKKYLTLKDSIFSKKNTQLLVAIQSNFELAKKEKENRLLKKESQLRLTERNYLFSISVLGIILIFVIFIRFRRNKKLSEELKIANATKDKFFNIIAHDLRNPFNTSAAFVDLLISDYDKLSDDEKKEILREIKNSFGKNVSLLENLLEWSLLQRERIQFSPKDISLTKLINDVISSQIETARTKNVFLQSDLANIDCSCDENMLRTALRNLISNAIKFTQNKGSVKIKLYKSEDSIVIQVTDTGIGIEKVNIPKLFKIEEKYTTRGTNNEPGTGLGLILCKEFVELNGGTLTVESELNVGSTFTITLPTA